LLLLAALPLSLTAQSPSEAWPPLSGGERLIYNLTWPSGLSLGEAVLQSSRAGNEIHLEATVIADLPQHRVNYTFRAVADSQLCSIRFTQRIREGSSPARDDILEFDQQNHSVTGTFRGRPLNAKTSACARDPLTFLYFLRRQLALGQTPVNAADTAASFYLWGDYSVRQQSAGAELGGKTRDGDSLRITYRGPEGEHSLDVWLRRDESRTPATVRMAFPLAVFSAELQ
jgi:hypothetical protein